MRRRGRVAVAGPIVLGGPVKTPFTGISFCGAIFSAFLAGIIFTLWLLLA